MLISIERVGRLFLDSYVDLVRLMTISVVYNPSQRGIFFCLDYYGDFVQFF